MPSNNTDNIYTHEYEDTGAPIPGTKIGYDNTETGLEATNMQAAIDELDGKIKSSDEADEITYDNTDSGLEATNVQAAIDELDVKIKASDEASEISYDNTDSGLTAENVQAAIDEVYAGLDGNYVFEEKFDIVMGTLDNFTDWSQTNFDADIESILSALENDELILITGLIVDGFEMIPADIKALVKTSQASDSHTFYFGPLSVATAVGIQIASATYVRYFGISGATAQGAAATIRVEEKTGTDKEIVVKLRGLKFKKL